MLSIRTGCICFPTIRILIFIIPDEACLSFIFILAYAVLCPIQFAITVCFPKFPAFLANYYGVNITV